MTPTTLAPDGPAATAGLRAESSDSRVRLRGAEPSRPQHMEALAEANRIRISIANHKKTIRAAGNQADALSALADMIEDSRSPIARAQLGQMLACAPRVRARMAEKLIVRIGLPLTVLRKQIGPCAPSKDRKPLTDRQRAVVVEGLRKNAQRQGESR